MSKLLPCSEIVSELNDIVLIHDFFAQFNLRPSSGNLLFRMTPKNADSFHKYCDNIPNLLVVASSKDGRKFGGFTSLGWTSTPK